MSGGVMGLEVSRRGDAEVKRHETRAAKDYRLNYRLNKACDLEIDRLCADVCSPFSGQACEGTVIQCLTQKAENVTDQVTPDDEFGAVDAVWFSFYAVWFSFYI